MEETQQLGDIRSSKDLGKSGYGRFIWVQCPDCSETRWTNFITYNPSVKRLCKNCAIQRAKKEFYVGDGLKTKN